METHTSPASPVPQKLLDELRLKLEHERLRLTHALHHRGAGTNELPAGDPAGDEADIAERTARPEVDERLHAQYEETLRLVEAAIARMENGSYGINARTGEVIPAARLEAVPWAIE
jgi:DnaK suppressor protein